MNGSMRRMERGRALVVVTDGLGFDPDKVRDLSRRVIGELNPKDSACAVGCCA